MLHAQPHGSAYEVILSGGTGYMTSGTGADRLQSKLDVDLRLSEASARQLRDELNSSLREIARRKRQRGL